MDPSRRKQFGRFVFDAKERALRCDGQPVPLTPKAFDLLAAFVEQPGRLLSKDELLRKIWPDAFVEESNLSYHVFLLRKAIGDATSGHQLIETIPKHGYRFTALVTDIDAGSSGAIPSSEQASASRSTSASRTLSAFSVSLRFGLAALILLPPALYLAEWSRQTRTTGDGPRAIPVTSLTGVVRAPSLSPDGKYVVFAWSREKPGDPDLYVQQIGSGVPVQLTNDPGNDYSPIWSPDGRTIAFLRRSQTSRTSDVWLIAASGGRERKISEIGPGLASYLPLSIGWCPDSRCVVGTDSTGKGGPDGVVVIDVATGEKRALTHPEGAVDADPAVAPDGRSLVFRRNTTPNSGVFYRLPLNRGIVPAGEPVAMTPTISAGKPTWMPDSREILYASRGGLWRLDVFSGDAAKRLPFVGQDGQSPVVSSTSDGRHRLVYVRSFSDANIWRVSLPEGREPAVAELSPAIASTRADFIPSVSPDGHRIAFISDRSGESQVWVADTDGAHAVQLTSLNLSSSPGFARWSPDGSTIAFHGDPAGRPDVIVVPASGGMPRNITADGRNAGFPSFSRDGRWIYFCSVQNGQTAIWKMGASGGAPVQVTGNPGALAIESTDGRTLYYVDAMERPSTIWRISSADATPVKIADGVLNGNFDVTAGGIYFIDRDSSEFGDFVTDRPGRETRLRYVDFATGRISTVARNLGWVGFGLSASPDGRTVFFSRIDLSIDELMMVDEFQ